MNEEYQPKIYKSDINYSKVAKNFYPEGLQQVSVTDLSS